MNQHLEVAWNLLLKIIWSSGIFILTFFIVGAIESLEYSQVIAPISALIFFCWMCISPKFPNLLQDLSIPFYIILGHIGLMFFYGTLAVIPKVGVGFLTIILGLFFALWLGVSYYAAFWKIRWCIFKTPNKKINKD